MADIVITGIFITPNPVEAGKKFIVSVEIKDRVYVVGGEDGALVTDANELILCPK